MENIGAITLTRARPQVLVHHGINTITMIFVPVISKIGAFFAIMLAGIVGMSTCNGVWIDNCCGSYSLYFLQYMLCVYH